MCRAMRPRVLILIILSAVMAALIAMVLDQKQRLEMMNAAEQRQYLGSKLEGKLSDEQIDRIAEAVSARLGPEESVDDPGPADQP